MGGCAGSVRAESNRLQLDSMKPATIGVVQIINRCMLRARLLLVCVGVLATTAACSHRTVAVPAASNAAVPDNSYIDLQPGWTLRIVVPLLKSGGTYPADSVVRTNGNTLTIRSGDLIGYEASIYSVEGKGKGVQIDFASAEVTRAGKTTAEPSAPALPFQLPRRARHIRLIYLVRISQADHNMAIVAANRLEALNAFTARFKADPKICTVTHEIACYWIPAGVAVRPEQE